MTDRSSVEIAEMVQDLRAGNIGMPHRDSRVFDGALARAKTPGPIVDVTRIYHSLVDNPKPVYIYEDHPNVAPPWPSAFLCYVNEHGNVIAMHLFSEEIAKKDRTKRWDDENDVDWSKVRWVTQLTVWAAGKSSTGQSFPVTGPLHMWMHAVYDKGEPADIRWIHLIPGYPMERWDMASLVALGALNYMACRNVDIVEPTRPRAEARRIARTGTRVHTINVFPVGRSTRSDSRNKGCGVPLTSVRGHFSSYGPDYGKGLLFGKLAGRFWIPQHARGDKALGENRNDYALRPEGAQ